MKKNNFTIREVLLDDYFLDMILNSGNGSFQDKLNLTENNKDPELSLIINEAKEVVMFNNKDKSLLTKGNYDILKSRIINTILKQ